MNCPDNCDCLAPRFPQSDEALQKLRDLLASPLPWADEKLDSSPILLTVYTNVGEMTVTVREDSIQYKPGGVLIAEGNADIQETFNDCYTFHGVIGYRTRPV